LSRFTRIALVCLIAVCAAAPAAQAAQAKAPKGAAFYKPPKSIAKLEHGDLIWARKIKSPLKAAARTHLLLYRSTSIRGKAIGVSGTLMVPKGKTPKGGWPVLSWAHGTTGIADRCAPSLDPGAYVGYIEPQVTAWLKAGYAIAGTDYEGLGTPGVHPYVIGRSEGRGVIDIVRAARHLDAKIGRRYAIAGHSQGGHAALWAAGIGPKWAPELRLRGVAAFAPASNLGVLSRSLSALTTPSPLSGLAALVLRGADAAYPSIDARRIASDAALELYPQTLTGCIGDVVGAYGGLAPAALIRPGADLRTLNRVIDAQNPDLSIKAPIFIAQGDADGTVPPFLTEQLRGQLRARKENRLTYVSYPGVGHADVVGAADERTREFLKARLR
jgi:pimeloyl-ACP methyl ester carboxylesterase